MIKVLIADDQELIRQSLQIVLNSKADIEVCDVAADGQDVIRSIRKEKPDVILMDIRMPKMDGVQCTKIIKENYPQIKIIILTTFDDDEYVYNALKFGASGYLLKGVSMDELENAMRYGSQSSLETRGKNDMGRFGLGMKMASMSQCRKMTVITKKSGIISAASWDLDHIIQKNNWALKRFSEKEIKGMPGYDYLKDHDTGTVVVWQEFDYLRTECSDSRRDFGTAFLEKVKAAREHVALVFLSLIHI